MYSAQQIELVANSLLPKFIPKDDSLMEFSFQFTLAPNNTYKVFFEKVTKKSPVWTYVKSEEMSEK